MIKQLTYVAGIVSVVSLLSACKSSRCGTSETASACTTTTTTEAAGAPAEAAPVAAQPATGNEVAIPLYEERVNVGKQEVPGQVQLRKYTTTETVNVPVELRHEHVVVERCAPGAQPSGAQSQWSGAPFQDKAITIQTANEQPIVQKQTVQTGQVIARKEGETQRINVQQQVRKEDVSVERNVNEAAGAQACPPGMKPAQSAPSGTDYDVNQ